MPPDTSLRAAVRAFTKDDHLRNVLEQTEWLPMFDEEGNELQGIRGRAGAFGLTLEGQELGADLIEMQPGAAFPLHVHPGDHLLYGVEGAGMVHVDGVDYPIRPGMTVFIAADQPHGVKTYTGQADFRQRHGDRPDLHHDYGISHWSAAPANRFRLLAVGHPHKHVGDLDRMHLLTDTEAAEYREKL